MSIRTEKVASLLQHELGSILEKELPRKGALVTIVAVKVTADLGIARFYVSIIGTEKQQAEVMAWLHEETKFLRKLLSANIRNHFRRIPEIEFYEDRLYEKANRIEQLLREVRKSPEQYD
ncbi:MAG: 30S ribosome-binding factor RbfA [Chlorobi bacterium]|nr:30S ribosome-binding factor RbfA [Chlorobiota bacterium]